MRYQSICNLPSTVMTLSRRKPGVITAPTDKVIIHEATNSPREINILRALATGQIVQVW